MARQKSFWKRYDKLFVVLATLFFIYVLVVFSQKINFILGNELILYLNPHQKSFSMHYGDVSNAQFDVSVENAAYCRASCSYSFNDRSTNKIIDNGSFAISRGEHMIKMYNLSVNKLGSGQDIFSFDAKCRSIRSLLCLTEGKEKLRSSLVTVNYDLTEAEKELKITLKQNLTGLLGTLSTIDVLHQQANQKYFDIGIKANLQNLSKLKIEIDDGYDRTRISVENLRSLWAAEDYIKLNQTLDESYFEKLESIESSILSLDRNIEGIVHLHNSLLSQINLLSGELIRLGSFISILQDSGLSGNFKDGLDSLNNASYLLGNNTFESYGEIAAKVEGIAKQQASIIEKSKIPATTLSFNSEYFLKYENDLLCSLNLSCQENVSIVDAIKNTEKFIENYPNSNILKQDCDSLKELEQKYLIIRNETLRLIEDKNVSFPSSDFFLMLANNITNSEIRKINNSYYESFEKIKSENKTNSEVIRIASIILPKNITKGEVSSIYDAGSIGLPFGEGCFGCGAFGMGAYTPDNDTKYFSLYLLSKIALSDKTIESLSKCSKLDKLEKIEDFNFEPISTNITYRVFSKIDTNLSDNLPICCIFNQCNPCCRDDSCNNDPKTFPIIFLHGHSFAKDNSPEFSLDAFNKLQLKLQDDGYLNAGIVSLYTKNEPLQQGIWGMSGRPVTFKVSYYYDAFRKGDEYIVVPTKSENIDTYAVRLKDLIDIVKERTNKPKVNIIAHSMGSLVARRFIEIFGENDIDKLVMIASPNKGISSPISSYCGLIGENRECEDMLENSVFLSKLNGQPKLTKVRPYSIIGEGCEMRRGDGDGVVLSESAELENSKLYYVNGTCGALLAKNLHTEILDIDKYPKTYEIVKEILKE